MDNLISDKIINVFTKYVSEIEADAHHPIRKSIDEKIITFIKEVRSNPKWSHELNLIKETFFIQKQHTQLRCFGVETNTKQYDSRYRK